MNEERMARISEALDRRERLIKEEMRQTCRPGIPTRLARVRAERAVDARLREERVAPENALSADDRPKHESASPPVTEDTAADCMTRPANGGPKTFTEGPVPEPEWTARRYAGIEPIGTQEWGRPLLRFVHRRTRRWFLCIPYTRTERVLQFLTPEGAYEDVPDIGLTGTRSGI